MTPAGVCQFNPVHMGALSLTPAQVALAPGASFGYTEPAATTTASLLRAAQGGDQDRGARDFFLTHTFACCPIPLPHLPEADRL